MTQRLFMGKDLQKTIQHILTPCEVCYKNHPLTHPVGIQRQGKCPGEEWQLDLTHMPKAKGYKRVLVWVDTFTYWVEAFPCKTEKAMEVVKVLIMEIIPRSGLPRCLESDNGPSFKSSVIEGVSKALEIHYHLHCAWSPQSSGKVERPMTSSRDIFKIYHKKRQNWIALLPIALFHIHSTPIKSAA